MNVRILIVLLTLASQSCVTRSTRWHSATTKRSFSDLCEELAAVSKSDAMETRKATMDRLGFETTTYSDGISKVSVFTRPDLVVVVPQSTDLKMTTHSQTSEKMWQAIAMQLEAIHTTSKASNHLIETVFMARDAKWTDALKDFHQAMTEKIDMRTVRPENAYTLSPTVSDLSADLGLEADIL